MRKKILGIMLCIALISTMFPNVAIAAGEIAKVGSYSCNSTSMVNDKIAELENKNQPVTVTISDNINYTGDIKFINDTSKVVLGNNSTYTGRVTVGAKAGKIEGTVASIGITYYTSLKSAFEAASKSKEKDVTVTLRCTSTDSDAITGCITGTNLNNVNLTLDMGNVSKYPAGVKDFTTFTNILSQINKFEGAVAFCDGIVYKKLSDIVKVAATDTRIYLINDVDNNDNVLEPSHEVTIDLNGHVWNGMNYLNSTSKIKVSDPQYWPVYRTTANSESEIKLDNTKYYPTVKAAIEDIPESDSASDEVRTICLQHDITDDIIIPGNKKVILNLCGHTINGDIKCYGELTIDDSTNTAKVGADGKEEITIGKGKITGSINNYSTLIVRAGIFNVVNLDKSDYPEKISGVTTYFSDNRHLDTGSSVYRINDQYIVMNRGNYQITLCYEIYDKNGKKIAESHGETKVPTEDVKIGENYTVKVFFLSDNSNPITLRGFDFTVICSGDLDIKTPASAGNRYDSVTKSIEYTTEENTGEPATEISTETEIYPTSTSIINTTTYTTSSNIILTGADKLGISIITGTDVKVSTGTNTDSYSNNDVITTTGTDFKTVTQIITDRKVTTDTRITTTTDVTTCTDIASDSDIATRTTIVTTTNITQIDKKTTIMTTTTTKTITTLLLHTKITKLNYLLAQSNYSIEPVSSLQVAQFDFIANSNVGDMFSFSFAEDPANISVIGSSVKIPVYNSNAKINLNAVRTNDGINVVSYQYAPETDSVDNVNKIEYKLAVIARSHLNGETLVYNNEMLYCTDNKNYIELSTDYGVDSVYLLLINPEELVASGVLNKSDKDDNAAIAEALDEVIEVKSLDEIGAEHENYLNFLPENEEDDIEDFDIYVDGVIDYNDASVVYQMLKNGGNVWSYDIKDVNKYLSQKSRLLSDTNGDAKTYGTIEDVLNVMRFYGRKSTSTSK